MSIHKSADPQVIVRTSIEHVRFHDGQVVDADALTAASMFPVSLLQLVLRSYLGCGIVCGLEVDRPDTKRPVVRIQRGVMVDCHGMPVELCREVVLDLTPDPCDCETEKRTLGIVMRRATSEDVPRRLCGCGCGEAESADDDCNRVRDQVLIKAVDLERLDPVRDHVCSKPVEDSGKGNDSGKSSIPVEQTASSSGGGQASGGTEEATTEDEHDECACLAECAEPCCADRSWVLLGSVTISPTSDGKTESGYALSTVDSRGRKYVKPIECCHSRHDDSSESRGTVTKVKAKNASPATSAPTSEA